MPDWKWKIGLNYSKLKCVRIRGADTYQKTYKFNNESDTIGFRSLEEHAIYVNCFGIDLERKINKHFSLKTGLFINGYGKKGSYVNKNYYSSSGGHEYRIVYCYFSVPLIFSFNYFQNNNIRTFVTTGVELNYLKWNRTWGYWWDDDPWTHGYDEPHYHLYRYQKNSYENFYEKLNKLNTTFYFTTGIDFKLYRNGFIRIEPIFNILLGPIGEDFKSNYYGIVNEKYFKLGVNFSLNFILKSKRNKQDS
jgi:hypothetical protein